MTAAILWRLFRRAFAVSLVQAAGVVLIAQSSPFALCTAFAINWLWIGNIRDGTDYRQPSVRWAYALGASCGTGAVLLTTFILHY